MWEIMILPAIACLILTGIHCYLGIHIVEREVIFVDLALAQIAALGSITAFLLGFHLESTAAYVISLLFTFLGALIFSLTRTKERTVPQEAIIGIVYVVAAAAAILILSQVPEEAAHLKEMLVGNILVVSRAEVLKIFILYSIIGAFHAIYRNNFILISLDPKKAEEQGISVRLWDFLFYTSFGFVVTSSVAVAGVLLVFSYLIVPAVCAMLLEKKFGKRLAIGWALGAVTSFLGLYFSATFNLPTGASIVCTFGLVLFLVALAKYLYRRTKRRLSH